MRIAIVLFPDSRSHPRPCDVEPIMRMLRRIVSANPGCIVGGEWVAGIDPIFTLRLTLAESEAAVVYSLPDQSLTVVCHGTMDKVIRRCAAC